MSDYLHLQPHPAQESIDIRGSPLKHVVSLDYQAYLLSHYSCHGVESEEDLSHMALICGPRVPDGPAGVARERNP